MPQRLLHSALCLCALSVLGIAERALAFDVNTPGWDLVFEDEFNGTSIDTSKWDVLNRRDSFNQEKQYYHPGQVTVTNGHARITATDEPLVGKQYRSGLIETDEQWMFGRFEASIDLPTTQGMWPAFWLLPREAPWPTGGEIDILENRGSQPFITSSAYHWNTVPNTSNFVFDEYLEAAPGGGPVNFHNDYHTYAAEWDPDQIRFYVNGNRHFTINQGDGGVILFDDAKRIIINLAVGGTFGGDPDGTTVFPQNMDIDYVRVWQRSGGFTSLTNAGFDENNGALADWTQFGNSPSTLFTTDAVSATDSHSLALAATPGGSSFVGLFQGVEVEGGEKLTASLKSLIQSGDEFSAGTEAQLKVEFYTQFGAGFESPQYLGQEILTIGDASSLTDQWLDHQLSVDVPANAVEARTTVILVEGGGTPTGQIQVDGLALTPTSFPLGDYNQDGTVNAADYTVYRDTFGSTSDLRADGNDDGVINQLDYGVWFLNFGSNGASSTAVPEPGTAWIALLGLSAWTCSRRRP